MAALCVQFENAGERPLIFVCHSLGGIIVKRVFNLLSLAGQYLISEVGLGLLRQQDIGKHPTPSFDFRLNVWHSLPRYAP